MNKSLVHLWENILWQISCILELIPHCLVQMLTYCVCLAIPTMLQRDSTYLPGVIMHLTTCHRKYDDGSEKITKSYPCLVFLTMLLGILQRMIILGELVQLPPWRNRQRNKFSPFTLPSLLASNFLQRIPPTDFCSSNMV